MFGIVDKFIRLKVLFIQANDKYLKKFSLFHGRKLKKVRRVNENVCSGLEKCNTLFHKLLSRQSPWNNI